MAKMKSDGASMRKRVLMIASCGGHWEQLMQLREAGEGHDVHFATTLAGLPERAGVGERATIIPDCNRSTKLAMLACALSLSVLLLRLRPQVVITTGALPGLIALALSCKFGIRTIWVDSIANAEELSESGKIAHRFAGLWLSQWKSVAEQTGATYAGRVI